MISVIIPVYKTEQYLKECLDSIVNQTYRDIDVILVDDGSPDQCPQICDEYASSYSFIRAYHIPNTGVSGARNYGIERARENNSDWLFFADSDDWLDLDTLEKLHDAAVTNNAEIAICGWNKENVDFSKANEVDDKVYDKNHIMIAMLSGVFQYMVCNVLWKLSLFDDIYFPLNTYFEDVRTTYKLFEKADTAVTISTTKYHYRQRSGSTVHVNSMKPMIDRWNAAENLYNYFESGIYKNNNQIRCARLDHCAHAALVLWSNFRQCSLKERKEAKPEMKQIASFVRKHFHLLGLNNWPFRRRLMMILTRHATGFNFLLANMLTKLNKRKHHTLFD